MVDGKQLALVKRIVHPLELGEVYDGPLNVSTEWRRRIDQHAAQRGVTGDYNVESIRSWIADLGYTGLDKPVSNLIIAGYAMLSDRAWLYQGSPLTEPPELDRIGPGYALRAQRLPGEEEFATARQRAAKLFGVHTPAVLFARNVHRLAGDVRTRVAELEAAVNGVRRSLDKHAADLGLPGDSPAARVVTARAAADLLARLSATADATPLVRTLTEAHHEVSDEVLGAATASAPAVLAALDRADWSLLESVRRFVGRGDGVGDQAERLVAEVAQAAADDEFTRALAPVLDRMRDRAVAIINEAARLAAVASPPPPVPTPEAATPATTTPPTTVSETPVSETGTGTTASHILRSRRRVPSSRVEAALSDILADLRSEIRDYATANPGAEIEIICQSVNDESAGNADGTRRPGS